MRKDTIGYRRKRRKRTRRQPTTGAWFVLIASWFVLFIALGAILGLYANRVWKGDAAMQPAPETAEILAAEDAETIRPGLKATVQTFGTGLSLRNEQPTILIYHTHTTEAYCPTPQFTYVSSGEYRTEDDSMNVVAIGAALKQELEQTYGFTVLHDTTEHEPPKLSTAYERSEVTMKKYRDEYPSLRLYIDLHRDAYTVTEEPTTDFASVYGTETARIMFVVGKGEKYEDKPYFDSNYALASAITEYLGTLNKKLIRPIRVKTGRYNQHIAPHCLLVEVGHNANTLEQALSVVPYLAEGIAFAVSEIEHGTVLWYPNGNSDPHET